MRKGLLPREDHPVRHFVAVAEKLHFPRAAESLDVSLAALYSSIEKLEEEVGHPLFARGGETRLTKAGSSCFRRRETNRPTAGPGPKTVAPAGGKAKASRGKAVLQP